MVKPDCITYFLITVFICIFGLAAFAVRIKETPRETTEVIENRNIEMTHEKPQTLHPTPHP